MNNQPIDDGELTMPRIVSLSDLEFRLGIPRETLRQLAASGDEEYAPFKQLKQPKPFQRAPHPTKVRDIDNPSKQLKFVQKRIADKLLAPIKLPHFLFGAVAERCIVKHATEHLNQQTLVKMDIKSYYPSVTAHHVYKIFVRTVGCSSELASLLTRLTTFRWHLPQGAPSSPALANLFLASVYSPVLAACASQDVTATAWVDDLIFSGDAARQIMELVRSTLAARGFKLSPKKRKILGPTSAKIVAGIRLGARAPRLPKGKVKDLRAALHKLELGIVPPNEMEKYLLNVSGRLQHIECVHRPDGLQLRVKFTKIIESLPPTPLTSRLSTH